MNVTKRSILGLGFEVHTDKEGWVQKTKLIKGGKYPELNFDEFKFDLKKVEGLSDFQKKIYKKLIKVPQGKTITYKSLGKKAGYENASRAVGTAMAKNKVVLFIPCHRVVRASGELGSFSGHGGVKTKRALLDFEALNNS